MDNALNVVVVQTILASMSFCLGLRREIDPRWAGWLSLEIVFAFLFVAESALKILAPGSYEFWCGLERQLSWPDATST